MGLLRSGRGVAWWVWLGAASILFSLSNVSAQPTSQEQEACWDIVSRAQGPFSGHYERVRRWREARRQCGRYWSNDGELQDAEKNHGEECDTLFAKASAALESRDSSLGTGAVGIFRSECGDLPGKSAALASKLTALLEKEHADLCAAALAVIRGSDIRSWAATGEETTAKAKEHCLNESDKRGLAELRTRLDDLEAKAQPIRAQLVAEQRRIQEKRDEEEAAKEYERRRCGGDRFLPNFLYRIDRGLFDPRQAVGCSYSSIGTIVLSNVGKGWFIASVGARPGFQIAVRTKFKLRPEQELVDLLYEYVGMKTFQNVYGTAVGLPAFQLKGLKGLP